MLDDIISPKVLKEEKILDYSTNLHSLKEYFDLHTIALTSPALQYLVNRGLTIDIINKLDIREGINRYGENFSIGGYNYIGRDYSGRIMVPSRRKDGTISFYLGRDYLGIKEAKYMNPPKELAAASEDVWNLDMVESDSVIICEGVFTAIAASPYKLNAVATYGKSIAQKTSIENVRVTSQGEKLLARKFKNYYIAYDADAYKEAFLSCEYLHERGANVYLILIDPVKYGSHADVADVGYDVFLDMMRNAIHYDGGLSSIL